jgi:CHAD domain-containing protein
LGKRKQWFHQQNKAAHRLEKLHRHLQKTPDETALHQFRIGLRSLRIQLFALKPSPPLSHTLDHLKAAGKATNGLRDRDALLGLIADWPVELTSPLVAEINDNAPPPEAGPRALRLKGFNKAMRGLPDLLTTLMPGKDTLEKRIRHTARTLRQQSTIQLEQLTPQTSPEIWHNARITVKKLRYLHEHLATWLPKRWRTLAMTAKPAQEALGHLHDLDVLAAHFGSGFSPALNLYWQEQRANALARADTAAQTLLQALARQPSAASTAI